MTGLESISNLTDFRTHDFESSSFFSTEYRGDVLPPTPNDPQVLSQLLKSALLLIDNGDYQRSQLVLENILARDPFNNQAIYWLGYCLMQTNDLENAALCFESLTKIRNDEESYKLLGDCYYSLGFERKSLESYHEALDRTQFESPFLYEIYKKMGNLYVRGGDFEAAEEAYNRALSLRPQSDVLHVNYGTLELQRDNLDEASYRFKKAIEHNRNNEKGWVGLAIVHRKKGDLELAWGALEHALDLDNKNLVALQVAVDWGQQDFRFDSPIQRVRDYLSQRPNDSHMRYVLAGMLYSFNHMTEALIETDLLLSMDSTHQHAKDLRKLISSRMVV